MYQTLTSSTVAFFQQSLLFKLILTELWWTCRPLTCMFNIWSLWLGIGLNPERGENFSLSKLFSLWIYVRMCVFVPERMCVLRDCFWHLSEPIPAVEILIDRCHGEVWLTLLVWSHICYVYVCTCKLGRQHRSVCVCNVSIPSRTASQSVKLLSHLPT